MKNSLPKLLLHLVLKDNMIINKFEGKINTPNIETPKNFNEFFKNHYNVTKILSSLNKAFPDSHWTIHEYVKRQIIFGTECYTITLVRVMQIPKNDRDRHRTHIVLPSFLLPYLRTCLKDVLCIISDENDKTEQNDDPFIPEMPFKDAGASSGMIKYIRNKFADICHDYLSLSIFSYSRGQSCISSRIRNIIRIII